MSDVRRFQAQFDSAKAAEAKARSAMIAATERYALACVESALAADRLERAKERDPDTCTAR